MSLEMSALSTFKVSSSGLPVYRVQFLNTETGEVVSDVDIETTADCVRYINNNPVIKEGLGFKKGEIVDTDLEEIIGRLIYPYCPPEFISIENIAALPEFDKFISEDMTIYKEKGKSVNKFGLAVTITAGSVPLARCSLIRIQNNTREMIENKPLSLQPGLTAILDFNLPGFSNDVQYFFELSDNENVVESVKINYEFILPIYVGYAKDGLLNPEVTIDEINSYFNGLITQSDRVEKRLVEINSQQKSFFDIVVDKDSLCPFILVPLKWNSLARIEDINGMDITKFFKRNNGIILQTSSDNTDYEGYKLYIAKRPADSKAKTRYLRDITYTFAYDLDWKDLASEGEQTEILTGFDVLTPGPIDSRFVKESYNELAYIAKPYVGLIVYIKNIKTYYKYNENGAWEVTNNMTRFYSGKPSDTMGGKLDISIDIATGDIYQKNNSNVWELKGNMRTGVTN